MLSNLYKMEHNHSHNHNHGHGSGKNIAVAFVLNFSFTIIELIGGLLTNSVAILSDALHDFGDSISLALAWYFEKISGHSPNARYSYGYKRFALLGALINATVLLLGSVFVIYASVMRIIEPQYVKVEGMFWLAILGVIINGLAVWRTHKSSGINERMVSLHLLEDVLGWIAVLIASVVMMFVDLPILDPILSVAISVFVLYNVVRNLIATFNVILQGVPSDIKLVELQTKLQELEGVSQVHDFHVWSLDSQYNIASLHAVIPRFTTVDDMARLKREIKSLMLTENIEHTTVEFETEDEDCHPCDVHP